jgi:rRNA maturation endonuclease Nob1
MVADTGAFITGFTSYSGFPVVAPPSVLEEVRDEESRKRLRLLEATGSLTVVEPPRQAVEEVYREARRAGLAGRLSRADADVLALALHLSREASVVVASDDAVVKKLARRLGIEVTGIRYK